MKKNQNNNFSGIKTRSVARKECKEIEIPIPLWNKINTPKKKNGDSDESSDVNFFGNNLEAFVLIKFFNPFI